MILSIFSFQFGEFNNSSPGWFEWLSILLTVVGFAIAFHLYFKQRRDNAKDAFNFFQDNLLHLKEAVGITLVNLNNFKNSLDNPNDNIINPTISVSLNDKFLDRIDITSLKRFYNKKRVSNEKIFMDFLKECNFLGSYYQWFFNEFNVFRENFSIHEKKFKQYNLLLSNLFFDVRNHQYEPHTSDFFQEYQKKIIELRRDRKDIIDATGNMNNRMEFNSFFVLELIKISFKYIDKDAKANEINVLANEVNAARIDLDFLKTSMKYMVETVDIVELQKINKLIDKLIEGKIP